MVHAFPAGAGATSVADPLKLSKVGNPQDLLYTLVAVSGRAGGQA